MAAIDVKYGDANIRITFNNVLVTVTYDDDRDIPEKEQDSIMDAARQALYDVTVDDIRQAILHPWDEDKLLQVEFGNNQRCTNLDRSDARSINRDLDILNVVASLVESIVGTQRNPAIQDALLNLYGLRLAIEAEGAAVARAQLKHTTRN